MSEWNADISLGYQSKIPFQNTKKKEQDRQHSLPSVTSRPSGRAKVRICQVSIFGWLHLTVSNSGLGLKGWGAVKAAGNGVSSTVLLALSSILFPVTAGVCGQGWQDRLTSPSVIQMCPSLPSGCPGLPLFFQETNPTTRRSMAPCCKAHSLLPLCLTLFHSTDHATTGHQGLPGHLISSRM